MASTSQISQSDLIHATYLAEALNQVPANKLSEQLDILKTTLSEYVLRMLRAPSSFLPTQTYRTYIPCTEREFREEILRILQLAKKHLINRKAAYYSPLLEPIEKKLALPKTHPIQLPSGNIIDDVPYSEGSLLATFQEEFGDEAMPLQGSRFCSSVLESIIISYKNYVLKQDLPITGNPSLSQILSLHSTLSDVIKKEILAEEVKDLLITGTPLRSEIPSLDSILTDLIKRDILTQEGQGSTSSKAIEKGIHNAIRLLLATISWIDYFADDGMIKTPSIDKFLFDYSNLLPVEIVILHIVMADFTTGLLEKVNICVHAEMLKRIKTDSHFDQKIKAIDSFLHQDFKFYAKSFGQLNPGTNLSRARYCAVLLTTKAENYTRLLQSPLSKEIPTFVLEFLFDQCVPSVSEEIFLSIVDLTKKIKESLYLNLLDSNPSPIIQHRLLILASYYGKQATVAKALSIGPLGDLNSLIQAFLAATSRGHIGILELFEKSAPWLFKDSKMGRALVQATKENREPVIDFLMSREFFTTCPTTGKNSVMEAARLAASEGYYSIFEKLMTSAQFEQILLNTELSGQILDVLALNLQLSLVCKIMDTDPFKRSLAEESHTYRKACGTVIGAFMLGCGNHHWNPLLSQIIASPEFASVPSSKDSPIGFGLVRATLNGNACIVRSIIANRQFEGIPAVGRNSIAHAFYEAAMNQHLPIIDAFLQSSRAEEIPLDGEFSISSALQQALFRGHLNLFLKLISLPRYREKLHPEERSLLAQRNGTIKLCLAIASNLRSEDLVLDIIKSDQFDNIPATGEYSLNTALKKSLKNRDIGIARAILASRRSVELSEQYICRIWDDAIRERLYPLNIAILESRAHIHIPLGTLKQSLNHAGNHGQLPLYLALQGNARVQSIFSPYAIPFLATEDGAITHALSRSIGYGHSALIEAIFQSESFARIPTTGARGELSLVKIVHFAIKKPYISVLQTFLRSPRRNELPQALINYVEGLVSYENAAPKNSVARFFWSFINTAPIAPPFG